MYFASWNAREPWTAMITAWNLFGNLPYVFVSLNFFDLRNLCLLLWMEKCTEDLIVSIKIFVFSVFCVESFLPSLYILSCFAYTTSGNLRANTQFYKRLRSCESFYTMVCEDWLSWGRILGRNWDRSLESFPPCYSQSPLITDFTPSPSPSKSGLKLVCM